MASDGPIPAGAGKPGAEHRAAACPRAYPRWRGGTTGGAKGTYSQMGLSPLARGNPAWPSTAFTGIGPIPAGAGEPAMEFFLMAFFWAYPCWRGGTVPMTLSNAAHLGLSPLARGNLHDGSIADLELGPIPAGAGEPRPVPIGQPNDWAYPRWRGGTQCHGIATVTWYGLSPLARGNPWLVSNVGWLLGLSPLARGNLIPAHSQPFPAGPIPAGAGEPPQRSLPRLARRAYPRWRGGTAP